MFASLPSKMKVLRICNPVLRQHSIKAQFFQNKLFPSNRTSSFSSSRNQSTTVSAKTEDKQDPPEIEYIVKGKTQRKRFLKKAEISEFITLQEEETPQKKFTDFNLDEILLVNLPINLYLNTLLHPGTIGGSWISNTDSNTVFSHS